MGNTNELSLFDTLEKAHKLSSLEGETPHETAALLRLLLAVLHRVVDTSSSTAWFNTWQAGQFTPTDLRAYFDRWQNRFDLFDSEHPFYQVHHELVEPKAAIKLLPGMLSVPLYYHAVESNRCRYTPSQAARLLVTAHTFATPGICHPQKKLFFNGAPWLAGKVFFLEGDSLFQTLMLNLLQYAPDHPKPNLCQTKADVPAWEKDDPFQPERIFPLGYLDYLTFQNRRVLLLPVEEENQLWVKEVMEAPGLKLEGDIPDPMKVYALKNEKEGFKMLYLNEAKTLWRECPTFMNVKHLDRVRVPAALDWVADLIDSEELPRSLTFRLMAIGLVVENQSKIVLSRQERMPLPVRYLNDPALFEQLQFEVQKAEETRNKVYFAVNTLARFILSYQADFSEGHEPLPEDIRHLMSHWNWESAFWPVLEIPFGTLIQDLALGDGTAIQNWHLVLSGTAWRTLDSAIRMAGDSLAAIKASVQARSVLAGGLKKLELSPLSENVSVTPE